MLMVESMQRGLAVDLVVKERLEILRSIMEMCMRKVVFKLLVLEEECMQQEQERERGSQSMEEWWKRLVEVMPQVLAVE